MNPAMLMSLMPLLQGLFGQGGQQGSSFSEQQQGGINDILSQIKGLKGNPQDITQNQNYQQGQDWLGNLFGNDQGFWDKFEAPLQRQFEENTIPDLANRFGAMGSGGSTGSTGFRNQLGREGSNLHTNIAALRGGMQQQGVNQALQYGQQPTSNLLQMLQQALGTGMNNQYKAPSGGLLGPALGEGLGAITKGFGQKWGESMFPGSGNIIGGVK